MTIGCRATIANIEVADQTFDALVYELYGFTEDESKIVEGKQYDIAPRLMFFGHTGLQFIWKLFHFSSFARMSNHQTKSASARTFPYATEIAGFFSG